MTDTLTDALGYLPHMISEWDPRSAREQLDDAYRHGGGWVPIHGHTLAADYTLQYPGDPPIEPFAIAKLRGETILVYRGSWVAVVQPDGSFEVCRMD
jgi:hypothetical protein